MTPDELRGRLTVTVPEAGEVLGIGRDASYRAAERGEIPVRKFGRRLVVPTALLLALLGEVPAHDDGPAPHADPTALTDAATGGAHDEQCNGQARSVQSPGLHAV